MFQCTIFDVLCHDLQFTSIQDIYVTKLLLNHTARPRVDVTGGYVAISNGRAQGFNEHGRSSLSG